MKPELMIKDILKRVFIQSREKYKNYLKSLSYEELNKLWLK
jgi:hypothetical protein